MASLMTGQSQKAEQLYTRALDILDNGKNGRGEPILRHLALRHDAWGMSEVARRFPTHGHIADRWSTARFNRRAWRSGNATAAYNQAMTCFNADDLIGYRTWLRRAAKAGDGDAAAQLRRFEVRLPHEAARYVGRHRPVLPADGFWSEERIARRKSAMMQPV